MMQVDTALTPETPVYRYLPFESFVAFVETGRTVLTNINEWDDQWEAILAKVPTVNAKGEREYPGYSFHQDIFGQSWTLLDESDAMWRIYSPTRTGLQLQTSVGKFELTGDVERAHSGKITYFESIPALLAMTETRKYTVRRRSRQEGGLSARARGPLPHKRPVPQEQRQHHRASRDVAT